MRCSKLGRGDYSLHAEGRAVEWHPDAASAGDRREARRLIDLLLAADRAGNPHALARGMGIQEIIHDRIHIGLSRAGARMRPDFWAG